MTINSCFVFTDPETAKMLSLSVPTLRRMRAEGTAPRHVRLGARRIGYRIADIEAWLSSRVSGGQPKAA